MGIERGEVEGGWTVREIKVSVIFIGVALMELLKNLALGIFSGVYKDGCRYVSKQ